MIDREHSQYVLSNKGLCAGILVFTILTVAAVYIDIPLLGPILGFLFLAIVPGLVMLLLLGQLSMGNLEKFVLSAGLSLSFVMLTGFLINGAFLFLGWSHPLSKATVVTCLPAIVILLLALACRRGMNAPFLKFDLRISSLEKRLILISLLFPLLSAAGMYLMNAAGTNVVLMFLLLAIPVYAILVAIYNRRITEKVYLPALFFTGLSVVLLMGMRSSHIVGADAHYEYYLFQQTLMNGQWQVVLYQVYDACLSISIVPVIYQSFVNVNSEFLFKMLYPILFSVSPLIVYVISKKYVSSFYAFLASLFFISQIYFTWAAFSPRTTSGILFFALCIMCLFHSGIGMARKILFFIIFSLSCITSHYSTAYVFLFLMLGSWALFPVVRRVVKAPRDTGRRVVPNTGQADEGLPVYSWPFVTIPLILTYFILCFVWYSVATRTAFSTGVAFMSTIVRSIPDFFAAESRGTLISSAAGAGIAEKSLPQIIEFVSLWMSILFIAAGIVYILAKCQGVIRFSGRRKACDENLRGMDAMFLALSTACFILVVAAAILPYISRGYDVSRLYFQTSAILATFFAITGIALKQVLGVRISQVIVLALIISVFMGSTGSIYQLFGVAKSIDLNDEGDLYDNFFVYDREATAARWIQHHFDGTHPVYSDRNGQYRLISQGGILSPVSAASLIERNGTLDGYLYIRYFVTATGKMIGSDNQYHDVTGYLANQSMVYNNGGSTLYYRSE